MANDHSVELIAQIGRVSDAVSVIAPMFVGPAATILTRIVAPRVKIEFLDGAIGHFQHKGWRRVRPVMQAGRRKSH